MSILFNRKNTYILISSIAVILVLSTIFCIALNGLGIAFAKNNQPNIYDDDINGVSYEIDTNSNHAIIAGIYDEEKFKDYLSDGTLEGHVFDSRIRNGHNYPVTEIGENAFASCQSITKINLPTTITKIGNQAFANCTNLKSIQLSKTSGAITFGEQAFSGCSSLSSIDFANNKCSIGNGAFENCTSLTYIEFPNVNGFSIGSGVFNGCTSLSSIILPENVRTTATGINSFLYGCQPNLSVYSTFDSDIYNKAYDAIYGESSKFILIDYRLSGNGIIINNVIISKGCKNAIITIPEKIESNDVTKIASSAFHGCSEDSEDIKVKGVVLPSSIKTVGYNNFDNLNESSSIDYIIGLPNSFYINEVPNGFKIATSSNSGVRTLYRTTSFNNLNLPSAFDTSAITNYDEKQIVEKSYYITKNLTSEGTANQEILSLNLSSDFSKVNNIDNVPYFWNISNSDLFEITSTVDKTASKYNSKCTVYLKKNQTGSTLLTATSIDGRFVFKYIINVYATPTTLNYKKVITLPYEKIGEEFNLFGDDDYKFFENYNRDDGLTPNAPISYGYDHSVVDIDSYSGNVKIKASGYTLITVNIAGYSNPITINLFVEGIAFEDPDTTINIKENVSRFSKNSDKATLIIYLPQEINKNDLNVIVLNEGKTEILNSINATVESITTEQVKDGNGNTVASYQKAVINLKPVAKVSGNFYLFASINKYKTAKLKPISITLVNYDFAGNISNKLIEFWTNVFDYLIDIVKGFWASFNN